MDRGLSTNGDDEDVDGQLVASIAQVFLVDD